MPLVCAIAWLILPLALPAIVMFLIIVVTTALLCFVTYHYLIQNSWLGATLIGKKFNALWPWQEKLSESN
jgi:glucan biosynthesis protein C